MQRNLYDSAAPVIHLHGNLPHWRQEGRTYFVTFRLADSVPNRLLIPWMAEKRKWLAIHPLPHSPAEATELWRRFSARFLHWLDAGFGACFLSGQAVASILERSLRFFDVDRYSLGEFVIMPNHVHALVTPRGNRALSDILHSWKSYSANRINEILARKGALWYPESFDHIVRSAEWHAQIARYIRDHSTSRRPVLPPL